MPAIVRALAKIVAAVVILLIIWVAAAHLSGLNRALFPEPQDVWQATTSNWSLLLSATATTAKGAFGGFVVGNAVGLALAVAVARSVLASRLVLPLAIAVRVVPIIALAPLLTLVLGVGLVTVITIAALLVFFPTLINGILGLRSVKPDQLDMMRMANASQWQVFLRLRLPAALPSLFAAFRVAAGACVLGALLAEWVASGGGLGYLILQSSLTFRVGLMWAAVILSAILAVAAAAVTAAVGRRLVDWE
jgi:NitT/TauT family transport system permease protein